MAGIRQQMDARSIRHGRNGREYRLPELPHLKLNGYLKRHGRSTNLACAIGTGVPVVKHYATCPQYMKIF
jgi:hypothetical protein